MACLTVVLFVHISAVTLVSWDICRTRARSVSILLSGIPFVGVQDHSLLVGIPNTNDTPPCSRADLVVVNRLDLLELGRKSFMARLHVLYVSQQVFFGSRKLICDSNYSNLSEAHVGNSCFVH